MPSNTELNAGSGGDTITTKQRSHDGDTTLQQVVSIAGVTGTEDSYTYADINGSAANGLEVDVTRVQGTVTVDGSGVTQPVSGTVTANLGATDNAVLDNIDSNTDFGAQTGGGTEASALRVTLANNSTGVLSVDDNGGSLTVDGTVDLGATDNAVLDSIAANTAAIQTAVEIIDNAISGNEMQVDIVSGGTGSTQYAEDTAHNTGDTGTMMLGVRQDTQSDFGADGDYVPLSIDGDGAVRVNAINAGGTSNIDTASGGTDEGAVILAVRDDSLTTLTPVDGDYVPLRTNSTGALHVTGGGGGTEYTEDDAAAANPSGNATILIRDDTPGTQVSADGDNVAQRGTNYGAAFCQIVDSSGNFVDSFGGSGGTAAADDADFTAGTTQGTPAMGVYESTPSSVTDGDMGMVGISSDRRMLTDTQIVGQDADITIADGGNSITVDGTVTANLSATDNTVLDNIDSNTDFGAQTGGGTEASALRVTIANNSTGVLSVDDNGGSLSIDDGGNTITVDGTVTANAGTGTMTVDLGANNDVTVSGENAHDGTTLGNPVLGGARATNSVEGITQVANADLTHIAADLNGVQLSRPHTTLEEIISERISNTNGTSTNFSTFNAGGAGIHNYVTDITVLNTSATDGYVDIRDGSAGSVLWTLPLPANGGATHSFTLPLRSSANTAVAYDVSAALTTVYISMNGFQAQG